MWFARAYGVTLAQTAVCALVFYTLLQWPVLVDVPHPCPGVAQCEANFGAGDRCGLPRRRLLSCRTHCHRRRPEAWGNLPFFLRCMRKQMASMPWTSPSRWDECAAHAMLAMARALVDLVKNGRVDYPPDWDGLPRWTYDVQEFGGVYVAILLGDHLTRCEAQRGRGRCGIAWASLEELIMMAPTINATYGHYRSGAIPTYGEFKYRALRFALDIAMGDTADVLTVGPYGFNNEPVFAPSLAMPTRNLRVASLVLREYLYRSSFAQCAIFPFSLQTDVELATLFLRDTMRYMRPQWVFAGDSGAVLLIARLATRLHHYERTNRLPHADRVVLAALQRSGPTWPPLYPPIVLSKLMPGHEQFAPAEAILSDDDGLREIDLPLDTILNVAGQWNANAFLKKEFSEASRGVARAPTVRAELHDAVASMFSRGSGSTQMDLDIRVRVFLQREVSLHPVLRAVGLRFFASRGRLIAGHSSNVEHGMPQFGVSYVTTRNARVEEDTAALVALLNYTGFGTAWWFCDRADRQPYLIDFNPRLERLACLGAALPPAMRMLDACAVFQRVANATAASGDDASPVFVPPGFRYVEPQRAMDANTRFFLQLLHNKRYAWNLWPEDDKARAALQWRIDQVDPALAAFVARDTAMAQQLVADAQQRQRDAVRARLADEAVPVLLEMDTLRSVCDNATRAIVDRQRCRIGMVRVLNQRAQNETKRAATPLSSLSPSLSGSSSSSSSDSAAAARVVAVDESQALRERLRAAKDASERWNAARFYWEAMQ